MLLGTSRDAALCGTHPTVLFSFLASCPSLQSQEPPLICHYFKALWVFPEWEPENLKPLCNRRRGTLPMVFPIGWGLGQDNPYHKCFEAQGGQSYGCFSQNAWHCPFTGDPGGRSPTELARTAGRETLSR